MKRDRYASLVEANKYPDGTPKDPEELLVFTFYPTGGLSATSNTLLKRLSTAADDSDITHASLVASIACAIIRGCTRVFYHAKRGSSDVL